jgi:hypothetical protein
MRRATPAGTVAGTLLSVLEQQALPFVGARSLGRGTPWFLFFNGAGRMPHVPAFRIFGFLNTQTTSAQRVDPTELPLREHKELWP